MYDNLDSVDPFYVWSSDEYSKLKKTCKEMIGLAKDLKKKALGGHNGWLKKKDRLKMDQKLNQLMDCVAAYIARKEDDIRKDKRDFKPLEMARMKMSARVSGQTAGLIKQFMESSLHSPMEWLRYKMTRTQSRLAYAKGPDLVRKAAEVLYYRSLSESEIRYKKSVSMLNTLTDKEVDKGTNEILSSPAFQAISKLPEKELRRLASQRNASELMKHFKTGLVEEKKSQKISVDINRGK
jgi:hypothetical protein